MAPRSSLEAFRAERAPGTATGPGATRGVGASGEGVARRYPALLLAGDRTHSREVRGRSKAFVEVGGRPMVVHVLEALIATEEVADVYVVGDARRLEECFALEGVAALAARAGRAVHIVPQGDTLYENIWRGFLCSLPRRGGPPDPDHSILVVPADVPLIVSREISEFVRKGCALDVDYVIGISPDLALEPFAPHAGQPGIQMACFNMREGRFRQNNLHLVRPLRIGNLHYVEDMYRARHQREISSMIWLGAQVVFREFRNLWVLLPYLVLHVAGLLDRRGFTRTARAVRRLLPLSGAERAASALLRTRVATVITSYGGAAIDIDNESDCEVADKMFDAWKALQLGRAPQAMLCPRD